MGSPKNEGFLRVCAAAVVVMIHVMRSGFAGPAASTLGKSSTNQTKPKLIPSTRRQWFEQINHNRDKLLICRYRKTGNRHRVVYSRSQYYQMRHDFDFAWYYPGSRLPRRTQSVSLPLFNQSVNPQDGCLCGKGFADYSGMRNVQLCLLCMQVNVGRTNHWGQPARTYKGRPFARTARDYVLEEVP